MDKSGRVFSNQILFGEIRLRTSVEHIQAGGRDDDLMGTSKNQSIFGLIT